MPSTRPQTTADATTHMSAVLSLFPTDLQTTARRIQSAGSFSLLEEYKERRKTLIPISERGREDAALVLVALVVEHGEGYDEEDEDGVDDVDDEPERLHGEREVAGAVVDGLPAGLAVGDVGGEHEDGEDGDGEAEHDDELGEVGLVGVVGVLVVDEQVDADEQHDHADHHRHDHQRQVEVPHRRRISAGGRSLTH